MRNKKNIFAWKPDSYLFRMMASILLLLMVLGLIMNALKVDAATTISYHGNVTYGASTVGNFTVNGVQAFCFEHDKTSPPTGTSFREEIYNNPDIRKALYYGWAGPKQWSGFESPAHGIVATSLVISHYYSGTSVKTACKSYYDWLQSQPAVPSAGIELSKSSVEAYLTSDKTKQRTEEITLNADSKNYITMKLPNGVTLHNVTKGTTSTSSAKIYGGDRVYLSAPLSQNGIWSSGGMAGAVGKYQPVVCVTEPSGMQNVGYGKWASDPDNKVTLNVRWIPHGRITLQKVDAELGKGESQGGGTLEGAEYKIYNTLGAEKGKMITDDKGVWISNLLPYDIYTVKETAASKGYLVEVGNITCNLNADNVNVTSKEQIIRGDLKLVKMADSTHKRLADVPFEITSKTTGESHVIVTDDNGEASTSSSWNKHSANTNRGQTSEDGVWFGEGAVNDDLGALPYDTYEIEEQACASNADRELIPAFEVTVKRDSYTVDLGTMTDDALQPGEISMYTMAANKDTGDKILESRDKQTIVDRVSMDGLIIGREYVLKGCQMVQEENVELKIEGKRVENALTFIADSRNMEVDMEYAIDATGLAGKNLVTYEELYDNANPNRPEKVAEHKDIEDEGQTVSVRETTIHTSATNKETGKKVISPNENQIITDRVEMKGLAVGREYVLKGWQMVREENKELKVDGKRVENIKTFVADKEDMTVDIEFVVDASELAGKTLITYEELYDNSIQEEPIKVAEHKDLEDKNQTIKVAELPEKQKATTVKTGDDNKIAILIALLISGAIAGVGAVMYRGRKRKDEPESETKDDSGC